MEIDGGMVFLGALALGLATAVAPCPLATNLAALSYISRKVADRRWVLMTGILYTLGRALTYFVLATLLTAGLISLPQLSHALSSYGHLFLGPILTVIGMLLLELIAIPLPQAEARQAQLLADRLGIAGAFALGVLFALAFCPTSAAYFATLISLLAGHSRSSLGAAFLYGLATALPVFAVALVAVYAAKWLGRTFQILALFDRIVRTLTGTVFLFVGVYFILLYNFKLPINIWDLF
jgi:cytochrome c-type biogenesis protein